MIDLSALRKDPAFFDHHWSRRGLEPRSQEILELDAQNRALITELQNLQSRRNQIAKEFGELKKEGKDTSELTLEISTLKERIPQLEQESHNLDHELQTILQGLPNLPLKECPEGQDESHNVETRKVGTPKSFSFEPKPHEEIGKNLGLMDFERSSKMSGSRFVVLYGALAKLERALAQFMLDIHTKEFGYQEVYPPILVRDQAMYGTGQLPKFREDQFQTQTGLWLIPTAEVVLTNLVAQEILAEKELPLRFTAYTPCFRAEAGSAGRDTHGMIRQHQFGKVELVSIVHPEKSHEEHERMTHAAETILQRLELPYRVMMLCAGDMGFCSQKTYDLEVWMPSQDTYREISSCSQCGDFQARRMNARYRSHEDGKVHFVHTLNGSGLAVGRTMVAILENYQNEDGSISIPTALRPYMGQDLIA